MVGAEFSNRTYAVCLVHLVLCIVLLTELTPGNAPLVLGGVSISPVLQWAFAAFNSISIISIIMAGVGTLYLIQSHLELYFWLLAAALIIDAAGIVVFCIWGTSCTTDHKSSSHLKDTVTCGFSAGGAILVLAILIVFKIAALFLVSRAKRAVRSKYSEELLPYLKKSLRSSFSEGSAFGPEAYYGGEFQDAAVPQGAPASPGTQSLSFRAASVPGSYGATMMDGSTIAANSSAPAAYTEPGMTI